MSRQQQEIERMEDFIQRNKARSNAWYGNRAKRLEEMEDFGKPKSTLNQVLVLKKGQKCQVCFIVEALSE